MITSYMNVLYSRGINEVPIYHIINGFPRSDQDDSSKLGCIVTDEEVKMVFNEMQPSKTYGLMEFMLPSIKK